MVTSSWGLVGAFDGAVRPWWVEQDYVEGSTGRGLGEGGLGPEGGAEGGAVVAVGEGEGGVGWEVEGVGLLGVGWGKEVEGGGVGGAVGEVLDF